MTVLINAIYTANFSTTQILVGPSATSGEWMGNVYISSKGQFGTGAATTDVIGNSNVRTSIVLNYYNGRTNLLGNNVLKYRARSTNPTTKSMQLFGANGNFLSSAKLYSCQIHDANNNVLADFIPVRKGIVGYLYDRISKILFGNSGTGNFVLGNDII